MDPRHPEQSIERMRDLMSQYDQIEHNIKCATTSAQLGQLEREGGLVVQEICLTAPRMHEALIQTSRVRRQEIARGLVEKCDETPEISMKNVTTPVEELTFEQQHIKYTLELDKELEANEKPKKPARKKTTKKKKAE